MPIPRDSIDAQDETAPGQGADGATIPCITGPCSLAHSSTLRSRNARTTLDRPLRTLTTLDRFGLLTWDGDTSVMRMLQVPELKAAMGFEPEFDLDHGSRRDRIRILGNGVCPPVMEAIVSTLTGANSRPLALPLGSGWAHVLAPVS